VRELGEQRLRLIGGQRDRQWRRPSLIVTAASSSAERAMSPVMPRLPTVVSVIVMVMSPRIGSVAHAADFVGTRD
jgi:hypothetical protein